MALTYLNKAEITSKKSINIKKRLSSISIIILLLQLLGFSNNTYAAERNVLSKVSDKINFISPFVTSNSMSFKSPDFSANANGMAESASSIDDLKKQILGKMINRENKFLISYYGNDELTTDKINTIMKEISKEDGYTYYSIRTYICNVSLENGAYNVSFDADYWTTKSEEEYIDKTVSDIIKQIIKPDMDEWMKEKAVHDYIVSHVVYDNSLIEHSAYAALAKGTTVCQGYALLTQKMFDKIGIKSFMVEGFGAGQAHLWNLVNLGGKWFHLDCTFDDPLPDNPDIIDYSYFNLSDSGISVNHVWNKEDYPDAVTFYSGDSIPNNPGEIVFADKKLDAYIRKLLNKPVGIITQADVAGIVQLDISSQDISSLNGLQYFTGLRILDASHNRIQDISVLTWLSNLKELNVGYNNINSISPLEALDSLEKLDLRNNMITDLNAIKKTKHINSLLLAQNPISDFGPVEECYNNLINKDFIIDSSQTSEIVEFPDKNLEEVIRGYIDKPSGKIYASDLKKITDLTASKRNISNLEGIQYCTELESLNLSFNKLERVDQLAGLVKLTSLDLQSNQIENIDALSALTKIEWLNLDRNQNIKDISALKRLNKLRDLFLCENKIEDISPISNDINLSFIRLNNNEISNIDALINMRNLDWLILNCNKISDISSLKNCLKLRNLELYCNQIEDLKPIENLKNLETLLLDYNKIKDISPLSRMAGLKSLYLSYNKLVNIDAIGKMSNLEVLYLIDAGVKNIDMLANCTKIKTLNLSSNSIDNINAFKSMKNLTTLDISLNCIENLNPFMELLDNGGFTNGGIIMMGGNKLNYNDPDTVMCIKRLIDKKVDIGCEKYATNIPIELVNSNPKDKEVNVDCSKEIRLYFNKEISKDSKFSNIILSDKSGNRVATSISIEHDSPNVVVVKPECILQKLTMYKIVIPNGTIASSEGLTSQFDFSIKFTTSDYSVEGVKLLNSDPKDKETDVECQKVIRLYFDKEIAKDSKLSSIILFDKAGNKVSASIGIDQYGPNVVIIKPKCPLKKITAYKIMIPNGAITSVDGLILQSDYSIEFTTGDDSISLLHTNILMKIGGEKTSLKAKFVGVGVYKKLTWKSDNTKVAGVDSNGVVVPKGVGTARIKVSTPDGKHSAFCLVTVIR